MAIRIVRSQGVTSSTRRGPVAFAWVMVAWAVMAALALATTPVEAQETTVPPATAAPPDTEPSETTTTTVPSEPTVTVPSTDLTEDGQPTGPVDTLTNVDGEVIDLSEDLGFGEEDSSDVPPDVDVTVPPPTDGLYGGQGEYQPDTVLVSNVNDARDKLRISEEAHVSAIALVRAIRLRLKELDLEIEALDVRTRANLERLAEAELRLRARALSAFVRGGSESLVGAVEAAEALDFQAQQTIVDIVFEDDAQMIATYQGLREQLGEEALGLFDRTRVLTEAEAGAEREVALRLIDIEQAQRELEAFEAGSQIYISGVVFPIVWPYELPLIDSWGFPRMPGTPDAHWHEGIDIFAPTGTPLVATERGVVTRIGTGRLGGLRLWLRGESGTDWYYAHLSAFAQGLTEGEVVDAGTVIGYVGATGNAVGTPPHLHIQVHPNGGEPVNPYPLLSVVSDRDRYLAQSSQDQTD